MPKNKELLRRLCPILHKGILLYRQSIKGRKNSFEQVLIKLIKSRSIIVSINVQSKNSKLNSN